MERGPQLDQYSDNVRNCRKRIQRASLCGAKFWGSKNLQSLFGLNPSWEIIVPLIDLMISVTVEDNISCSLFGGLTIIQPDCRVIYATNYHLCWATNHHIKMLISIFYFRFCSLTPHQPLYYNFPLHMSKAGHGASL